MEALMALSNKDKYLNIEKMSDVLKRVPISKATLHRYIKAGIFPPQVKLGSRASGFLSHEVDAYLLACVTGDDKKRAVDCMLENRKRLMEESRFYR